MKRRTKPEYWSLEKQTDDALLRIALNKLKQRTLREGDKMDELFEKGVRDEKQRSKFYAHWYAFEALRIYAVRRGVKVGEPFLYGEPEYRVTLDHLLGSSLIMLLCDDLVCDSIKYCREDTHAQEANADYDMLLASGKLYGGQNVLDMFKWLAERQKRLVK